MSGPETVCVDCGDDLATEGYLLCTECLELLEQEDHAWPV